MPHRNINSNHLKIIRYILKTAEPFIPARNSKHRYNRMFKIWKALGGPSEVCANRYDGKKIVLAAPDFVRFIHGAEHKRFGASNLYPLMHKYVTLGDIVIDVGAGMGDEMLDLSGLVGPEGHVFCFEPEPRSFKALQQTIELNGLTNVTAINMAVGKESGKLSFDDRLTSRLASSNAPNIVDVITLNEFCRELGKVSFIKIDTDGFDLDVLDGANELIAKNPDCKIIMEFLPSLDYSGKVGGEVLSHLMEEFSVGRIQTSCVPITSKEDINHTLEYFSDRRHQICHDVVLTKKSSCGDRSS